MDEKKEINIDKKSKEVRYKILETEGKFIKFNKTTLLKPKYLKVEELRRHILELNASYDYIDDITKGMTEDSAIKKLEEKIKEGLATKWLFERKQHNFKRLVKK